jgi:hypothetical protein
MCVTFRLRGRKHTSPEEPRGESSSSSLLTLGGGCPEAATALSSLALSATPLGLRPSAVYTFAARPWAPGGGFDAGRWDKEAPPQRKRRVRQWAHLAGRGSRGLQQPLVKLHGGRVLPPHQHVRACMSDFGTTGFAAPGSIPKQLGLGFYETGQQLCQNP